MTVDLFHAQRRTPATGYTWTLPSRLAQILDEVENRYGERDRSWTILGIELGPDSPQVWYPGPRQVIIQLSAGAENSWREACYQLAHECVHLLAPSGGSAGPVIEEGAAEAFAVQFVERQFQCSYPSGMASYLAAASLVRDLLQINPDAIRLIRKVEPSFSKWTVETFARAGLDVPLLLRTALVAPFVR